MRQQGSFELISIRLSLFPYRVDQQTALAITVKYLELPDRDSSTCVCDRPYDLIPKHLMLAEKGVPHGFTGLTKNRGAVSYWTGMLLIWSCRSAWSVSWLGLSSSIQRRPLRSFPEDLFPRLRLQVHCTTAKLSFLGSCPYTLIVVIYWPCVTLESLAWDAYCE